MSEDRPRPDAPKPAAGDAPGTGPQTAAGTQTGAGNGKGGAGKDERTVRLEQALRANLRRRKAQSRARIDAPAAAKDADEPE